MIALCEGRARDYASAPEAHVERAECVSRARVGGSDVHMKPHSVSFWSTNGAGTIHVSYDTRVIILQGAQEGSQPRISHSTAYKSQDIFVLLETFVFFKV